MDFDTGRRRFLEIAGTGTALSLAGCSALQGETASQTTESATEDTAASGETQRVTVALRADQEALQERQQSISSELRSGNISRAEAQQQFQTAQQELLANAATSFTDRVESTEGLTVVDSVEDFGVFLVEGPAASVLDTLSFGSVNALLAASRFQRAKQQAQQAAGTATGTPQDETGDATTTTEPSSN